MVIIAITIINITIIIIKKTCYVQLLFVCFVV